MIMSESGARPKSQQRRANGNSDDVARNHGHGGESNEESQLRDLSILFRDNERIKNRLSALQVQLASNDKVTNVDNRKTNGTVNVARNGGSGASNQIENGFSSDNDETLNYTTEKDTNIVRRGVHTINNSNEARQNYQRFPANFVSHQTDMNTIPNNKRPADKAAIRQQTVTGRNNQFPRQRPQQLVNNTSSSSGKQQQLSNGSSCLSDQRQLLNGRSKEVLQNLNGHPDCSELSRVQRYTNEMSNLQNIANIQSYPTQQVSQVGNRGVSGGSGEQSRRSNLLSNQDNNLHEFDGGGEDGGGGRREQRKDQQLSKREIELLYQEMRKLQDEIEQHRSRFNENSQSPELDYDSGQDYDGSRNNFETSPAGENSELNNSDLISRTSSTTAHRVSSNTSYLLGPDLLAVETVVTPCTADQHPVLTINHQVDLEAVDTDPVNNGDSDSLEHEESDTDLAEHNLSLLTAQYEKNQDEDFFYVPPAMSLFNNWNQVNSAVSNSHQVSANNPSLSSSLLNTSSASALLLTSSRSHNNQAALHRRHSDLSVGNLASLSTPRSANISLSEDRRNLEAQIQEQRDELARLIQKARCSPNMNEWHQQSNQDISKNCGEPTSNKKTKNLNRRSLPSVNIPPYPPQSRSVLESGVVSSSSRLDQAQTSDNRLDQVQSSSSSRTDNARIGQALASSLDQMAAGQTLCSRETSSSRLESFSVAGGQGMTQMMPASVASSSKVAQLSNSASTSGVTGLDSTCAVSSTRLIGQAVPVERNETDSVSSTLANANTTNQLQQLNRIKMEMRRLASQMEAINPELSSPSNQASHSRHQQGTNENQTLSGMHFNHRNSLLGMTGGSAQVVGLPGGFQAGIDIASSLDGSAVPGAGIPATVASIPADLQLHQLSISVNQIYQVFLEMKQEMSLMTDRVATLEIQMAANNQLASMENAMALAQPLHFQDAVNQIPSRTLENNIWGHATRSGMISLPSGGGINFGRSDHEYNLACDFSAPIEGIMQQPQRGAVAQGVNDLFPSQAGHVTSQGNLAPPLGGGAVGGSAIGGVGGAQQNFSDRLVSGPREDLWSSLYLSPRLGPVNHPPLPPTPPPRSDPDSGVSSGALNNQVSPGMRANNYYDNLRSFSRQNRLDPLHSTPPPPPAGAPPQSQASSQQACRSEQQHGVNLRQLSPDAMPANNAASSYVKTRKKYKINREQNRNSQVKKNCTNLTRDAENAERFRRNPRHEEQQQQHERRRSDSTHLNNQHSSVDNISKNIYSQIESIISSHERSPEFLAGLLEDLTILGSTRNQDSSNSRRRDPIVVENVRASSISLLTSSLALRNKQPAVSTKYDASVTSSDDNEDISASRRFPGRNNRRMTSVWSDVSPASSSVFGAANSFSTPTHPESGPEPRNQFARSTDGETNVVRNAASNQNNIINVRKEPVNLRRNNVQDSNQSTDSTATSSVVQQPREDHRSTGNQLSKQNNTGRKDRQDLYTDPIPGIVQNALSAPSSAQTSQVRVVAREDTQGSAGTNDNLTNRQDDARDSRRYGEQSSVKSDGISSPQSQGSTSQSASNREVITGYSVPKNQQRRNNGRGEPRKPNSYRQELPKNIQSMRMPANPDNEGFINVQLEEPPRRSQQVTHQTKESQALHSEESHDFNKNGIGVVKKQDTQRQRKDNQDRCEEPIEFDPGQQERGELFSPERQEQARRASSGQEGLLRDSVHKENRSRQQPLAQPQEAVVRQRQIVEAARLQQDNSAYDGSLHHQFSNVTQSTGHDQQAVRQHLPDAVVRQVPGGAKQQGAFRLSPTCNQSAAGQSQAVNQQVDAQESDIVQQPTRQCDVKTAARQNIHQEAVRQVASPREAHNVATREAFQDREVINDIAVREGSNSESMQEYNKQPTRENLNNQNGACSRQRQGAFSRGEMMVHQDRMMMMDAAEDFGVGELAEADQMPPESDDAVHHHLEEDLHHPEGDLVLGRGDHLVQSDQFSQSSPVRSEYAMSPNNLQLRSSEAAAGSGVLAGHLYHLEHPAAYSQPNHQDGIHYLGAEVVRQDHLQDNTQEQVANRQSIQQSNKQVIKQTQTIVNQKTNRQADVELNGSMNHEIVENRDYHEGSNIPGHDEPTRSVTESSIPSTCSLPLSMAAYRDGAVTSSHHNRHDHVDQRGGDDDGEGGGLDRVPIRLPSSQALYVESEMRHEEEMNAASLVQEVLASSPELANSGFADHLPKN